MPRLRVLSLRSAVDAPNYHLDVPVLGGSDAGYVLPLVGWVHPAGPTGSVVNVFEGGSFVRSIHFNVDRPDVAQRFGGPPRVGFSGGLLLAGRPSHLILELRLGPPGDPLSLPFARIEVEHAPVRTGLPTRRQPLAITSLGRTGTTLLMGLLSRHPAIAVHRLFPYETRLAGYWMHTIKVLAESPDLEGPSQPSRVLDDPFRVATSPFGALPYTSGNASASWLQCDFVDNLARFAQQTIDEHYDRLFDAAAATHQRYFAEKCLPNHVPRLFREIYPEAREVFLLRDFRDMADSIQALNRRRGFKAFGEEGAHSQRQFLDGLRAGARALVEAIEERQQSALVIRYEDLVRRPEAELRRLLSYLELGPDDRLIEQLVAAATHPSELQTQHRTSDSSDASVGRWRRNESAEQRALVQEAFDGLLQRAGYAPG